MKFNKDTFLNDVTSHVQTAIDKNIITQEDIETNDLDRLHGFIQYELLEYIKDRAFSLDVLRNFSYDEVKPWSELMKEFGEFKSLLDLALVNLWLFLKSCGATSYDYYETSPKDDSVLLDVVHQKEAEIENDTDKHRDGDVNTFIDDENVTVNDDDDVNVDNNIEVSDETNQSEEPQMRPRRKIRIAPKD